MERFEEFLNERKYLLNVSHKTLVYYKCAFKSWEVRGGEPKQWGMNLRQAGLSAISVNTYICAMNAYWKWAGEDKHLAYLKEEQKILATLTECDIHKLIRVIPIKSLNLRRAHLVALTILDCGLRASECLSLSKADVDMDNLVLRIKGKGGKQRLVPFSTELRKALFKWIQKQSSPLVFGTRNGTKVSVRNIERDFKQLSLKLGISGVRFSPHTLRHTFACEYLKRGGNLFYLSRILGHSSIKTTELYLKSLGIADLQAAHSALSPLSRCAGLR